MLSLVVVDPLTGEAAFATAGNEPPLVLRANGEAAAVEGHGMALGIQPDEVLPRKSRCAWKPATRW